MLYITIMAQTTMPIIHMECNSSSFKETAVNMKPNLLSFKKVAAASISIITVCKIGQFDELLNKERIK